ncbi:MAG: RsmD family RNA methyltransferase [Candidatus Micrarchaeota archaeon]|nr:RsmD family RNA methyltransferase [Candidatus Micrarchaeota archaeon]
MARGYDLLGNIAVIEPMGRIEERKKAQELMKTHEHITTVLAKAGAVSGRYRTRKHRYVAGKRTKIAIYKENGCTFKFNVDTSFFSNRLSYERSRIMALVRKKENVMVMFAGVGPFAIEIAKTRKDANVAAVELNKNAYKYMLENIKLNKAQNVVAINSDVKKIPQKYKGFADRVVMPMPKSSLLFLDQAFMVAKKRCVVHIYSFGNSETASDDVYGAIKEHAKKNGYKVKRLLERTVRPYSAKEIEIVIDFQISR